jgi:heparin binding hemagglutinin HbhA
MAVSLPTSADIRKAREQAAKTINEQAGVARTPLLAVLGVTDIAATALTNAIARARSSATEGREAVSELPNRLSSDELRKNVEAMTESAKKAYVELAKRGEQTWTKLRQQPQVQRVMQGAQDASGRFEGRFDGFVDEVHDAAEDALNRITRTTRSTGEKTARRAQRLAGQAAESVQEAGASVQEAAGETAERIEHAGDEAAHAARSTSRKAAARTQPAKDDK